MANQSNQSNHHRNGNNSYYPLLPPLSREMGPPDFPLQPMDIDLIVPRTNLPHGFGDVSYAPASAAKMPRIEGYSRPQDPITQWYTGNDGPWVPHKAIPEIIGDRLSSKHLYRQPNPSETGSFSYNVPRSDSGYGTARRSVGNTSVFSLDQDCQSLTSHITDYHSSYQGINEVIQQRDAQVNEVWGGPSDMPNLICRECGKSAKTQSEMNKHNLRHTKPFVCQVQGCSRTEGFSTTNDLERHTKSKHRLAFPNLPIKKFRCWVADCKSKDKAWPRLDNFRSHLKRVHLHLSEAQFEALVQRAEFLETPLNIDQDLTSQMPDSQSRIVGESSFFRQERHDVSRGAEYNWKPLRREINDPTQELIGSHTLETKATLDPAPAAVSPQSEVSREENETVQPVDIFPPPKEIPVERPTILLAQVSENGISSSTNSQEKAARQTLPSDATITEVIKSVLERTDSGNLVHDTPSGKASPTDPWLNGPRTASPPGSSSPPSHTDSPSESLDSRVQAKALEVVQILRERGFIAQGKEPVAEPEIPQNAGSAASNKSENQVTCQTCKKFTGRPCELKKHMKRHERPYGCTFTTCNKTFGSKNDWKRHENSQHYHLETWRCDEIRPESEGSTVCGKVCYRKQTFQEHLGKAHHISTKEKLDTKLDTCRMGINCQARFWCGFCEKTIELKKTGLDAWTERFDHIDDHFMGRNGFNKQSILDWTAVDGDKSKSEVGIDTISATPSGSSSGSEETTAEPSGTKRNRSPEEVEESAKKVKLAKTSAPREILIYCCQCDMPHNPKLNKSCSSCADAHFFCDSCETRNEKRLEA